MVQNSNKNGRGQQTKGGEGWVPDTYRPPCASTFDNKQFRKRCLPQTLCHLSHCTSFLCHRSCNQLEKERENSIFFTRKTGPALKRPFHGFSTFYMDQLVKIRRHRLKREPKIVNMPSLRDTCCKVTKIYHWKVATFYRRLYGRGKQLQNSSTSESYIYARFRRITFKLGKYTNIKALFSAVSMDFSK